MSENLELQISVKGADKSEKALSSLEKTLISIDTTLSKLNTSAFDSLANSLNKLNGIKISSTVGKNINVISEALSKLETDGGNFDKLADGISKLNGVKVSKTIGTGLESITNSLNNISKVKPINPQLATNLDILGSSMQGFVGLNGIQFTGIAKLTSTLAQTGKVKAFDDKIIKNAEKLGQAINKLDKDVSASNPRLEALAKIARQIAPAMRDADKGTNSFGKSLRLLNFDAILNILDRAVKKLKEFTLMLKGIAFESAGLENAMSFFNQSLGTYARREMEILNKYAQIGAIDLKNATQQIAGMNQMLIGYGHNADNAAKMSRVLYQIAVDASFAIGENGRDVADKMKQLESAMAGLPKSLYGWGVDTSVANIIENFDEATRGMNKFTKSIYTYQMILASTRGMQGQFAREFALATTEMYMLENQTKKTVQAIGFAIKPMFLQIVKWAFVTLRVIELVIEALSRLFGFDYQKVDYMTLLNGMNEVTSASDNIGAGAVDNLDKAQKEAKKLKKYLAGFDELNVMEIPTSSGGAVGGAIGGGIGSFVPEDYDLLGGLGDEMENYFKELDAQAEKVFETLKKILPIATAIGAALLAWKLATALAFGLNNILELLGRIKGMALPSINLGAMFVGVGLFMDAISKIKQAVKDIIDNGANFDNVTLLLEGLTEGLGAFFLTVGNFKIGGALLVVSGVIGIIQDIKSIASEGANFDNVMSLIDHFGIVLIGIGAFTGNKTIFGVGAIIKGAADVIQAIKDIQENGFTKSNVWELIQGALIGLGGVLVTLGGLKMLSNAKKLTEVQDTVTTIDTGMAGVSTKLVSLAKNLAVGLVIITEVAIAAGLIVGAIWLLGKELEQVGIAWEPVIANGDTILTALGLGTALLVAVGVATYALGTASVNGGGTIPVAIGVGTAMLALLGVATGLFLIEVELIGKELTKINEVWTPILPVLPNIEKSILEATKLLGAVGLATFLLGTLTVGTGGTLPIAIGVGTAMLILLAEALISIIREMDKTGESLIELNTTLGQVTPILPTLETNLKEFTSRFKAIATEITTFSKEQAVTGFKGVVSKIVSFFTGDPLKDFIKEVKNKSEQFGNLNTELEPAIANMDKSNELLVEFQTSFVALSNNMNTINGITVSGATINTSGIQSFTKELKNLSQAMIDMAKIKIPNFSKGYATEMANIDKIIKDGMATAKTTFQTGVNNIETVEAAKLSKSMTTAFNTILSEAQKTWDNIKTSASTNFSEIDRVVKTITSGITNEMRNMSNNTTNEFNGIKTTGDSVWNSIRSGASSAFNAISTSATKAVNEATRALDSLKTVTNNIASSITRGVNNAVKDAERAANNVVNSVKSTLKIKSPSRVFRDEIGYMMGLGMALGIEDSVGDNVRAIDGIMAELPIVEPEIELSAFDKMTNKFTETVTSWKDSWIVAWEEMAKSVETVVEMANSMNKPFIPSYSTGGISSNLSQTSDYSSNNDDIISAIERDGYNRDSVMAELIDAITNSETVVELDGRTLGKFIKDTVNARTERAGKTVFRT